MKKTLTLCITLVLVSMTAVAEDYQYQYFKEEKEKYVPFSDYIPRSRLHYKTVPHYLEDFYLLYGLKQYYNENTLRKNIGRLKFALTRKFRHPSQALVKVETEQEYLKYRNLMFMHINILIMRNYLKIGHRYDKKKVYFYNQDFADEILDSLDTAEKLYREAIPYWNRAKKYAEKASRIKITTDLGHIESERFSIIQGDLDYGRIINTYITKLNRNREKLRAMQSGE